MKKLKKLGLNKTTLSNLNKQEMNNFLGGKLETIDAQCLTADCPPSIPCVRPPKPTTAP